MSGPDAGNYQQTIATSAVGRIGTVDEIATAAAFLLGPDAGFITGADLLIDGGVVAALRAGRPRVTSLRELSAGFPGRACPRGG